MRTREWRWREVDLEKIMGEFKDAKGLILDLRGNGGGGVPQVKWPEDKPTVILIDPGTMSAGEGFVAYFGWGGLQKAHPNLRIIGQTTSGTSSEKRTVTVPSGLFSFNYSARGRKGVNNCGPGGLIEYYGVRPDVEVMFDVEDLKKGEDTYIKCATSLLGDKIKNNTVWPLHSME